MVADNSADGFLHEGAATQSDDGRLVFERLKKFAERLLLQLSISCLALLGKQRRNCAASAPLDQRVEVEKGPIQDARQFPADRRLASSHEPNQHNQLRFGCHITVGTPGRRRALTLMNNIATRTDKSHLSRILAPKLRMQTLNRHHDRYLRRCASIDFTGRFCGVE